ncbi:MAG: Metalloprotease MmpA [bacterium ADurb.Bin429]|nr:MAG: Metalloprotease MmpA [bacterium ADurb.Bin429]
MDQLTGYLGIIIVFGTIIAIHEFGHFIVAKLSGMTVHEFAIGFGPALISRVRNGTRYSLRLLPLGGFVRIAGMEPGEENEPNGFYTKPFFAKFATILAGVTMNFILALLVFIIMGVAIGRSTGKPVVRDVTPGTPAAQVGMQARDRIIEVAGVKDPSRDEAIRLIQEKTPPISVVVLRGDQRLTYNLTPVTIEGQAGKKIGVVLGTTYKKIGVGESIKNGFVDTYAATRAMIIGLGMLVTGQLPEGSGNVTGFVGIGRLIHDAASSALLSPENMSWFLFIFALISLNIAIVNLLPIPALDGSHLVILILERLRGKEFDPQKKAMVHLVGMVLLLALMVIIIGQDIINWVQGKPAIPGR